MCYSHETWWKWLPHDIIIFAKFHEDSTKIVDFFYHRPIFRRLFFSSDFINQLSDLVAAIQSLLRGKVAFLSLFYISSFMKGPVQRLKKVHELEKELKFISQKNLNWARPFYLRLWLVNFKILANQPSHCINITV